MFAYDLSNSGSLAQCSITCDGNSTKSRDTAASDKLCNSYLLINHVSHDQIHEIVLSMLKTKK